LQHLSPLWRRLAHPRFNGSIAISLFATPAIRPLPAQVWCFNGSIAISLFATVKPAGFAPAYNLFQWLNRHKPLCNDGACGRFAKHATGFNGSIAISLFATPVPSPTII